MPEKRDLGAASEDGRGAEKPNAAIKVGTDCIYTYMVSGSDLEDATAKVVAVWPGQVVDLDVKLGERTQRHYRVHQASMGRAAHTWRLL